jgi:hypothetical protein
MRWHGSWHQSLKVRAVRGTSSSGTAMDPRLQNVNITDVQEVLAWAAAEKDSC